MKLIIFCLLLLSSVKCNFNLYMHDTRAQPDQSTTVIYDGDTIDSFDSTTFNNKMICTNGMLKLIQYNATNKNQSHILSFRYSGDTLSNPYDILILPEPNLSPYPFIINVTDTQFNINVGCQEKINNDNYYNHLKIIIKNKYEFSLLINCNNDDRHKKFQFGYLLIGMINAAITIGVALHSRIWSIKFHEKPLRIMLTWKKFLFLTTLLIIVGVTLYFVASKEFKQANLAVKYIGLGVAFIFTFICSNEVFYLFNPMKKVLKETSVYVFRICELVSFIGASILFVISLFVQNWILYTFLACCICVGSIKMLYFDSMQQAFYSLAISTTSVTLIAIILHFELDRSYNDYASELSSPLFIEVPDLINNLFKKCSWLPVVDIIVPGVFLSFLRSYDENFNTGWGGVYTIVGNVSFLSATTLWIAIQAIYPFSVPFSLITYSLLLLSIGLIAFKRNQLKTLWYGTFLKEHDINEDLIREKKNKNQETDVDINRNLLDDLKMVDSISDKDDKQQSQKLKPGEKQFKSAFHPKNKPVKRPNSKPSFHQI